MESELRQSSATNLELKKQLETANLKIAEQDTVNTMWRRSNDKAVDDLKKELESLKLENTGLKEKMAPIEQDSTL